MRRCERVFESLSDASKETNLDELCDTLWKSKSEELEEVLLEERTFRVGSNEASEDGARVEIPEEELRPEIEGEGERDESDCSSELRERFGGEDGLGSPKESSESRR